MIAQDYRQELLSDNMSNPAAKQKFMLKQMKYQEEKSKDLTFKPEI